MTLRVTGVHGVRNFQPQLSDGEAAGVLSRDWQDALEPGVRGEVDLRVAYYAPHLNNVIRQGDADGLDDLPPPTVRWLVSWADQLGALPADVAQAAWSIPARMIADRIADHHQLSRLVVRPFVSAFLTEVHTYLSATSSPARKGATEAVAAAIREHRPQVVLAHSLGSVVAYEALWANLDLQVPTLITVGSPLGMRHVVFDRLQPAPGQRYGHRPPNVERWINIADPGDIVAIPRPFTDRFQPDENWEDQHIHWLDFHGVRRYLASPRTLAALATCLQGLGN